MSTIAGSVPLSVPDERADRRRRIIAIIGASSGNLVEWYDFYAYAFTSIFRRGILSDRRRHEPAARYCGHLRRRILHASVGRLAVWLACG